MDTKRTQKTGSSTIKAIFFSLFLGRVGRLLALVQENFPELGLVREDCIEMSWIESSEAPFAIPPSHQRPLEFLLNRTMLNTTNVKVKSDYVKKPIPKSGIEGIVRLFHEPEAEEAVVYMIPYGGRMAEISESATPFPHRGGNLYMLASIVGWQEDQDSGTYKNWSRRYYSYLTPYVSRNPREAYLNYRDLDIGVNNVDGETSYAQASVWGKKYFKNNFDRLVRVKTEVDPENFFKNEQSVPPFHGSEEEIIKMHFSETANLLYLGSE